jgi:TonB family protein
VRRSLLASAALHGVVLCVIAGGWRTPAASKAAPAPLKVALVSRPAGQLYQPAGVPGLRARAQVPAPAPPPVAAKRPAVTRPRVQPEAVSAAPSAESGAGGVGDEQAPGGALTGQQRQGALMRYLDQVLPTINAHTLYPEEAERLGLEGAFVVRIAVDRAGRVVNTRLVGDPPHGLLRRSALAALTASAPLPPPPPELGAVVEVDIPFVYRLDGAG